MAQAEGETQQVAETQNMPHTETERRQEFDLEIKKICGPIVADFEERLESTLAYTAAKQNPDDKLKGAQGLVLPDLAKKQIINRIQEVLANAVFGVDMSSQEAEMPPLSEEIRRKIDDGVMTPLDLVNGEFGSRYAPACVVDAGSPLSESLLASQRLRGNSAKVFHARRQDTCPTKISRDCAFSYPTKGLFDAISNFNAEPVQDGMIRFNLGSATLTMRGYGTPQPAEAGSYMHWHCPKNNPGAAEHDFSKCGGLYANACNIATVWNAAMWASMGKPDPSTDEYQKFMDDVAYSKRDVEDVTGAMAYMYNKRPKEMAGLMQVCYSHLPEMDNTGKHPNTADLYRHVSTIKDQDELDRRLGLIASRKAGEWSDEAHWRSATKVHDIAPTRERQPAPKMHMVPPEKYCFDIADHRFPGAKTRTRNDEWGRGGKGNHRNNSTVTRITRRRNMYKEAAEAQRPASPAKGNHGGFQGAYRRRR